MIIVKNKLSSKEQLKVRELLEKFTDLYGDFYITKENLRLFIKENQDLLFDCLAKGDKIIYGDEGILIVTGYSDKSPRKYVKIIAQDEESASKLLKVLNWNVDCELWVKVKKRNPLRRVFLANNFQFYKSRGKELLLRRGENYDKYNKNKDKKSS